MKNDAKEELNAEMVLGSVWSTVNVSNIFDVTSRRSYFYTQHRKLNGQFYLPVTKTNMEIPETEDFTHKLVATPSLEMSKAGLDGAWGNLR